MTNLSNVAERAAQVRAEMAEDLHRPRYHFLPPANWMNDPHGLIQWKGQYHLFYQYNPENAHHDRIQWGHAVSDDLVHWQDLPIALTPTPDSPDADGCWSGCTIDHDGTPTIFYSAVFPQTVAIATSDDDLLTWQKYEGNPVIGHLPDDLRDYTGGHFRDPYVWKENGHWYMLMGSKIEGTGGLLLLYRSDDLIHWDYLHPLMIGDVHSSEPFWTATMWECPNLLRFGDTRLLFFSIQATPHDHLYPIYYTGTFLDHHFAPTDQGIMAYGGYFYAPQAMHLDDGRHVMFGWLKEGRSQRVSEWAKWAGVQSLPLTVDLLPSGELLVEPVEELQKLRQEYYTVEPIAFGTGFDELFDSVAGDSLEIIAEFESDDDAEFGLILRSSPDGQEQTRLVYRPQGQQLVIERAQSSLSFDAEHNDRSAPVELAEGENLKLHIFIDRSVIEVFVNGGRTYLSSRIYPLRSDSLGVGLFARSGHARLLSLEAWTLASIW